MTMELKFRNSAFVEGEWIACDSDGVALPNMDPANNATVTSVFSATDSDVERAISAAEIAFENWGQTSGAHRARFLETMADELEVAGSDLCAKSSLINGKPLFEAELDHSDAVATFRYYAEKAKELDARQEQAVALATSEFASYRRYEPAGVAVLITPWNFPLVTTAWKIAPALAAGCTVILKPSEAIAAVELEWGNIAQAANLPPGVLNILPGNGAEIGPKLIRDPRVNKVSFTGGNATGSAIMRDVASGPKNLSLELGGKSPILVFEDADLDQAVEAVMTGIFFNCGQMCSATSRLLVQNTIADVFMARLSSAITELKIGPSSDVRTQMGPMTTQAQYEKVLCYLDIAKAEGLNQFASAKVPDGAGWFLPPTVFSDVPKTSRLWREEIFGPVLCVRRFATEDAAIAEANDSDFGLAATVCSVDELRLRRVSARLRAGHIWWNMPQIVPVETSWGGFGASGIGRELGEAGLGAFQEIKHVDYATG